MRVTGLLVEGWDDRQLEIDDSPDNPQSPRVVGWRPLFQSRTEAVVLIFYTEYRGTQGRFFGLTRADGWVKLADLP